MSCDPGAVLSQEKTIMPKRRFLESVGSNRSEDMPSSSSSPLSSGVSESPREPSISLSTLVSPTGRPDDFGDTSFFLKSEPAESDLSEDRDEDAVTVKAEPGESSSSISLAPAKRARGRPRKVKPEVSITTKSGRGRTKTGCITCRRRKKKCDERKPFCSNCQQNNVNCEGYPKRVFWQDGRQRKAAQNRQEWEQRGAQPLPQFLFPVEKDIDWTFYKYYETELSRRLNISPEKNNPFIEIVLPMAQSHQGVMSALLSCSAAHYMQRLGSTEDKAKYEEVAARQRYHQEQAYSSIAEEEYPVDCPDSNKDKELICRALLLWLQTIVAGESNGEWKVHERYFMNLLTKDPMDGEEGTWKFAREFWQYHKMSSFITNANTPEFDQPPYLQLAEGNKENFMSICDRLEMPTLNIHILRKKIRQRRDANQSPFMSYQLMQQSYAIDDELKALDCKHEVGTEDWICWHLYHKCVWLLLQRSIMSGPHPTPNLLATVKLALEYLGSISPDSSRQSILVLPVFLIGLCAFLEEDRQPVLDAFEVCEAYSHNGNIKHARDVIQELWTLMDAHDKRAWDYERVIENMGVDTLFT